VGALTLVTINNMVDLTRAAIIKLNAILLISILSLLHAVPDETSIQRSELIDNPQRKSAFTYQVHSALKYYRLPYSDENTSFRKAESNNTVFRISLESRRNNFEEVVILGFSCVGKVMQREMHKEQKSDYVALLPSIVTVHCSIPVGRDGSQLTASTSSVVLRNFIDGTITASEFWNEVMNSLEYVSEANYINKSPSIFITDVEYENLIAARIALENQNNPRSGNLISMASKAKYVWGLQAKVESMLMEHMKSKHMDLMIGVMGKTPNDEEMLRLGRLVFLHVQKPQDELIETHTGDSLRYVWGGGSYPKAIDQYYDDYYERTNLPRPRRKID